MKFNTLYESLLMEMPYVDVLQHGEHTRFDLEIEKYSNDLEGFKNLLKKALTNGTIIDKYGNRVHLTNHEERIDFLTSLGNSDIVELFLRKYHNTTLLDIVKSLK